MLTPFLICAVFACLLSLGVTTVRVRLQKAWDHEGDDFVTGEVLEISSPLAEELVTKGIAKRHGPDAESDEDDVEGGVKKGKTTDGGTAGEGDDGGTKKKAPAEDSPEVIKQMALMLKAATAGSDDDNRQRVTVHAPNWTKAKGLGYAPGDEPIQQRIGRGRFMQDIVEHANGTPMTSRRLKHFTHVQEHLGQLRMKALGSDEYAALEDSIGGFFVQPQFDDRFLTKGFEAEWIRANGAVVIPTNSTLLKINAEVDRDRQVNLYGGIAVAFQGERELLTATKGKFEQIELKPDWLTGMYFATETILRSASALGAIVGRQFQNAFQRKETLSFVSGTGAGEPLGVIPSAAAKVVNRSNTGKIEHEDVIALRKHQFDYANSIWVAAMGTYEELANMARLFTIQNVAATENVGGSGTLTWQENLVGSSPQGLLGRPLIFTEHLPALGNKGDLMNISWSHYIIAESTDTINDSSIHIRFDSLETAFRFAKRLDGQPWWRSTLLLQNGFEVSPFVVLN